MTSIENPAIAREVDSSIVVAQDVKLVDVPVLAVNPDSVPIPRLYHYNSNVLVFNESFGGGGFATLLNRIHGFIDCIHDQFDPQRKNIFFSTTKGNNESDALKQRIWEYFIGTNPETNLIPTNPFYANGKDYYYNTGIHTLAHALEIEDSAQDTGIELKITEPDYVTNDHRMPFKCKKWGDIVTSPSPTATIDSMTVYKFTDYNPPSGQSGVFGEELRTKYLHLDGVTNPNKYYIHDCGSKSFHDEFVKQTNPPEGKAISFFSGILDSSTTNDPVPINDVSDENIDKLQFEIPYLYLPGSEGYRINVHCKFKHDDLNTNTKRKDIETLVLTFKLLDASGNPVLKLNNVPVSESVNVKSENVPSLPDVSEFLSGKLGCINAIKRMVTGKNPCKYLKGELQELFALYHNKEFEQMFMIAFKHMGDKIRLIDAIIANNVLSNGKCHTATVDTFSNRYAISGNLHTILPIKTGHYIYVNNYHSIDVKMIKIMKKQQIERDKETNKALCAQIQMLVANEPNLKIMYNIIHLFCKPDDGIFDLFKNNCKLKGTKMGRRCLGIQYWDVSFDKDRRTQTHEDFLNVVYDKDDNAKINTTYDLMNCLYNKLNYSGYMNSILDYMNSICTEEKKKEERGEEAYANLHTLKPKLNLLLELYGMYTKIVTFNIGISGNTIINNDRKTMNLKLFASIMSKCKFGGAFTNGKQDVRSKVQSGGGDPWNIDGFLDSIYNEEKIEKELEHFEITYIETEQNRDDSETIMEDNEEALRETKGTEILQSVGQKRSNDDDNCIRYENMKDVITVGCNYPKKAKGARAQRGGDYDTGAKLLIYFLKLQHEANVKYQKLYEDYENFLENEISREFGFDEKNKDVEVAFQNVEKAADEVEKHFAARKTAAEKAAAEEATRKAAAEEATRKAAATKINTYPPVYSQKQSLLNHSYINDIFNPLVSNSNHINSSDSLGSSYSSESDRSENEFRNNSDSDKDSLDNDNSHLINNNPNPSYLIHNNPYFIYNRKRNRKGNRNPYSTVSPSYSVESFGEQPPPKTSRLEQINSGINRLGSGINRLGSGINRFGRSGINSFRNSLKSKFSISNSKGGKKRITKKKQVKPKKKKTKRKRMSQKKRKGKKRHTRKKKK